MLLQTGTLDALAWPVGLLAVGVALVALGYHLLRPELRRLRSDPVDAYEATNADGLVELRGTAVADEHVLEAPFTGFDCLAYRFEVEEYRSSGKNSYWEELANGGQYAPFRLEDDTGTILVDPGGDDFHFDDEWQVEVDAGETVQGRAREFLESLDDVDPGEAGELSLGPIEVGTGDRRRYTEQRLEPGESVSVYGPVEYDADAGREWGTGAVNAAVRRTDGDETLVVADANAVPTLRSDTYAPIAFVLVGALLALYGASGVVGALLTLYGTSGAIGALLARYGTSGALGALL